MCSSLISSGSPKSFGKNPRRDRGRSDSRGGDVSATTSLPGQTSANRGNPMHNGPVRRSSSHSSSFFPLVDPGRFALRVSVVCVLISACAGWVFSGGHVSRVAEMLRAATVPLYHDTWVKQEECRAAPAWDADLSEMREAVEAFDAREYTPPVWARNAHLHTIVASGDMEKKLLGDRTPLGYWRERWPTPDGDFVDIDWLPAEEHDESDDKEDAAAEEGVGLTSGQVKPDQGVAAEAGGAGQGRERGRPYLSQAEREHEATMEQLREAALLAEQSHGSSLGIGHPEAAEMVHDDHPSWMTDRRNGKAGQGSGERRLVLLLHGLEGSSTAPLTKRFSSVYSRNGFDVAALNFRGCSGELGKYPLGYHLGFTDDLLHVVEEVHRRFPDTWDKIYLSGFSLGGNVIVKFLGEQGDRARELGIYGASVGCVPFEPQLGAEKLDKDPVGRFLYMPVFMAWLNIKATEHAKAYPETLRLEDVQNLKTFTQFDNHVTRPVFGFSSTQEYYSHVNAANYLSRVRVPLMVINARDDPFIEGETLPGQERVQDAPVRLIYHNYGGHCGFMSGLLSSAWRGSKTHNFTRKWGAPWGSNWMPWGSSGGGGESDPEAIEAAKAAAEVESEISEIAGNVASATAAAARGAGSFFSSDVMWTQDLEGREERTDKEAVDGDGDYGDGGMRDGAEEASGGRGKALKEGRWLPTELARFIAHLDESLHAEGRSQRVKANRPASQMAANNCVPSSSSLKP